MVQCVYIICMGLYNDYDYDSSATTSAAPCRMMVARGCLMIGVGQHRCHSDATLTVVSCGDVVVNNAPVVEDDVDRLLYGLGYRRAEGDIRWIPCRELAHVSNGCDVHHVAHSCRCTYVHAGDINETRNTYTYKHPNYTPHTQHNVANQQ